MRVLVRPFTLDGHLVGFHGLDELPKGSRKVGEVPDNGHTFYKVNDSLVMESCAGDFFEIIGYPGKKERKPSELDFVEISQDFEDIPDPFAEWQEAKCRRAKSG